MAVPFAFPEENNDADVIIRQIHLLLTTLTVELQKLRKEKTQQQTALPKVESGSSQDAPPMLSTDESTSIANVGDHLALLNAFTGCKHFNTSNPHVLTLPGSHGPIHLCCETVKDPSEPWEKIAEEVCQVSSTSSQREEDELTFPESKSNASEGLWSWLVPQTFSTNSLWTTAVICVVGWHLLR